MRFFPIAALVALTACSNAPELDDRISPQATEADFPTLIALDGPPVETLGASASGEVIQELDGRTESLWARIASLF